MDAYVIYLRLSFQMSKRPKNMCFKDKLGMYFLNKYSYNTVYDLSSAFLYSLVECRHFR